MKTRTFVLLLTGFLLAGLFSFRMATYDVKNSTGDVDLIQGVYIFAKCKPAKEYDFLGTVKGPKIGEHEFDNLVELMLKNLKKNYPTADGLIFDGPIKQTHNTTASAVKFK